MTIRNALRVLQDEGLTNAEHGRGVYVRARPPVRRLASDRFAQRHRKEGKAAFNAEAAQIGARPQVDMLTVTEARPPADAVDRLGLADDADMVVRSRRYLLDGKAGGDRRVRALEFYDRWLPGTMRRIDSMTRGCVPNCVMRRRW